MNNLIHDFTYCPADTELAQLIALRKQQIQYTNDIKLIIFNQIDSLESLNQALGFDILTNHWDGFALGCDEFSPSWEYIELHQNWLEVAYLYNDAEGALLFIELPLSEPLKSLLRI